LFKPGTKGGPGFDLDRELKVTRVDKDSAVEKAGLKLGDVMQKVNGKEVKTRDDVAKRLAANAGSETTLVVDREGESVTITYTPRLGKKGKGKGKSKD
jgi:S1-C subfamily serine protease